jgi:hypothetical protein
MFLKYIQTYLKFLKCITLRVAWSFLNKYTGSVLCISQAIEVPITHNVADLLSHIKRESVMTILELCQLHRYEGSKEMREWIQKDRQDKWPCLAVIYCLTFLTEQLRWTANCSSQRGQHRVEKRFVNVENANQKRCPVHCEVRQERWVSDNSYRCGVQMIK